MRVLHATHHALQRLLQYNQSLEGVFLPNAARAKLSQEQAIHVRKAVKAMLGMLEASRKVLMPDVHMLLKSLKYGETKTSYFHSPNGVLFHVVHEDGKDTVVTCSFPEHRRRMDLKEDQAYPKPGGMHFIGLFEFVDLPYFFKPKPGELEPIQVHMDDQLDVRVSLVFQDHSR